MQGELEQEARSGPVAAPGIGLGPRIAGRHGTVRRFPMSAAEEIFAPEKPEGPSTMQFELRVSGAFEEEGLREAIAAAVAVHPMARARLVAPRFLTRVPRWEVGEADMAGVVSSIDCDDEAELASIRDAYYSRPIDLCKAPALTALIVRRPGGDSLLFSIHHSIMDGMGALRWINSVARAYSGRPDPVPDIDPIEARDLKALARTVAPSPTEVVPPREPDGPVSQVAGRGEAGKPGYGIRHREISPEQVALLDPCLYEPDATLNDLLIAALHLTIGSWNAGRGLPADWISVLFPSNVRPPEWNNEVVGNLAFINRNLTSPEDRSSPERLLAVVTDQTRRVRAGQASLKYLTRPPWARWVVSNLVLPLVLYRPRMIPQRVLGHVDSILFANLGRIEKRVSDFGAGAGKLTGFWVSPPIAMPMGIGMDAALLRGRVHLSLRYRHALLDDRDAEAFLSRFVETLTILGRGSPRREGGTPPPTSGGPFEDELVRIPRPVAEDPGDRLAGRG